MPRRLGRSFRWLLAATVINNVGDGVAISAGRCWSRTRPAIRSSSRLALMSEYLPVLLFGVLGGAAADRFDRQRLVVAVNLVRAIVLVGLVGVIVTGTVNIAVVLAALLVLGTRRPSPIPRAARWSPVSFRARTSASRTRGCSVRCSSRTSC